MLGFGQSQEPGGPTNWRAGGVMLQHMPKSELQARGEGGTGEDGLLAAGDLIDGDEGENWRRANLLLDTADELELVGPRVTPTDLLVRLFHEESAACLRRAAGAVRLHLFGGSRAPEPVDLFGQGHRAYDDR
jgi:molecular chaperone Hsp33